MMNLLNFLDPEWDIGHQQRQLSTIFLTGPVVSGHTWFCLDSSTPFPQFVSSSRRVPLSSLDTIQRPLKSHLFAGLAQSSPICAF